MEMQFTYTKTKSGSKKQQSGRKIVMERHEPV